MRMMLALAECKSMTRAAKQLGVTQPALTYQLNVIEDELGFKVFNRTRTGTSLTREGEFLLGAIGNFVADYEEALRLVRAMSTKGETFGKTAVIGTVAGDKHDIGKNLVRITLESRDVKVIDLGTEVAPETFVEHVRNDESCGLVLVSVSQTNLLEHAREVVDGLTSAGLRERVAVMLGGTAATQQIADEIGADAFTESAEQAADQACKFLSK